MAIALYWCVAHVCPPAAVGAESAVLVPGTSDPWLAGLPNGATASECSPAIRADVAPAQSPILVTGIEFAAGDQLTFKASGRVAAKGDTNWLSGPEGHSELGLNLQHVEENGLSGIKAPVNGLLGVFLGPEEPGAIDAPEGFDFTSAPSREYERIAPSLRQVFFIGAGYNLGGQVRRIEVPKGATRLFLGVMDQCVFWDNKGEFLVTISSVPSGFFRQAIQTNGRFSYMAIGLLVLAIGWLAGAVTGYLTAFFVSRLSYRKVPLDLAVSHLKACCHGHRHNTAAGFGLEHTACSFVLLSEILQRAGQRKEAKELRAIASEMESLETVPESAEPTQRNQRDSIKDQWAARVRKFI